jgi:cell division protein FtsZ
MIVVPNEKLLAVVEKNLGFIESFKLVDDILSQAVGGISNVILSHGDNDINLDFADVKTIMTHRGLALMGVGYSAGTNAAYDAAKAAIESPLLDNISIDGAMGVLVHFDIHPEYPILEISEAMNIVEENADEDANVIFGTTTNPDMDIDEVKITIIATGFEEMKTSVEPSKTNKTETPTLMNSGIKSASPLPPRAALKKVVGGDYGDHEDILDVPTFLRKQMD